MVSWPGAQFLNRSPYEAGPGIFAWTRSIASKIVCNLELAGPQEVRHVLARAGETGNGLRPERSSAPTVQKGMSIWLCEMGSTGFARIRLADRRRL